MPDDYKVDISKAQENIENMVIRATVRLLMGESVDTALFEKALDVFALHGVPAKTAMQILSDLYDFQEDEDEN